jgi:hypothetical protein
VLGREPSALPGARSTRSCLVKLSPCAGKSIAIGPEADDPVSAGAAISSTADPELVERSARLDDASREKLEWWA